MSRLDNKTAIVTGGGGGIGGAICRRLSEEGARVAIFDLDIDAADTVADAIRQAGGQARAYKLDITDYQAVGEVVAAVGNDLGAPGILVNNAGHDRFMPFLKTEPDLWRSLIDTNLIGALNLHHQVLPGMVQAGGGRVVNIASDAARVGSSGESVYAACKAGLAGLSKTLARELATKGITVNVVCPGPTDTALLKSVTDTAGNPEKLREAFRRAIPMGRLGQPDDFGGLVALLASDDAAFMTGQVISVSGGLTMAG